MVDSRALPQKALLRSPVKLRRACSGRPPSSGSHQNQLLASQQISKTCRRAQISMVFIMSVLTIVTICNYDIFGVSLGYPWDNWTVGILSTCFVCKFKINCRHANWIMILWLLLGAQVNYLVCASWNYIFVTGGIVDIRWVL